ncbi:MAG TPA: hypothetical protein VN914_08140 [Polyangia bacterium]|nr:hypothetical protein [Polyangia bacterium]
MRALACGLVILLAGGCASGRTAGKVVLGALVVGSAALAVGAAVKGNSIESKLGDDYRQREITGMEFATRDSEGQRWNRIGRAATFVGALSLLGLGVIWEMSLADRAQNEAPKPQLAPIFPVPSTRQ